MIGVTAPVPAALRQLTAPLLTAPAAEFSHVAIPAGARESAVLILFGADGSDGSDGAAAVDGMADPVEPIEPDGFDVLLTERAHTLRSHPGQVSFPGGRIEPGDADASSAALRETQEETGLDPAGVQVLGTLPGLGILPSRSRVVPVLGWWAQPTPVAIVDPAEVARVLRVPLARLADPSTRVGVRHHSGFTSPGFVLDDLLVWGFTGLVLDGLLRVSGREQPWDRDQLVRVEDWQQRTD